MITAKEARELFKESCQINSDLYQKELDKIDKKIRDATLAGNGNISHDMDVGIYSKLFIDQLVTELLDLGFDVDIYRNRSENFAKLVIRW